MRRVIIESPYSGLVTDNIRYLRECMAHAIHQGEAPFASHGLYTQPGVLDDGNIEERNLGIEAGYAWWYFADLIAFYTDNGWSAGMIKALERARMGNYLFEYRSLRGSIKQPDK